MQTNFSKTQLEDKDNQSTEKIFKKCVHCGMCNATCPTHQLLGDELDGPRGRIYLIKDMLENNKKPTEKCIHNTSEIIYKLYEKLYKKNDLDRILCIDSFFFMLCVCPNGWASGKVGSGTQIGAL